MSEYSVIAKGLAPGFRGYFGVMILVKVLWLMIVAGFVRGVMVGCVTGVGHGTTLLNLPAVSLAVRKPWPRPQYFGY
jgi:hypothetical protein